MTTPIKRMHQQGAVSIFIVIFTMLLVSVVTLSFIQLMIKGQQAATANDLSQSAYDSALAGVEDAKRVLLLDQACRAGQTASAVDCAKISAALSTSTCNTIADSGLTTQDPSVPETIVQQDDGGTAKQLSQAYTCVKITTNTDFVTRTIPQDESIVVPLHATGTFKYVVLSWFNKDDAPSGTITFPSVATNTVQLPLVNKWGHSTPALLRAQYISMNGSLNLTDLDNDPARASTIFLYPRKLIGSPITLAMNSDARRTAPQAPKPAVCSASVATATYACSAILELPEDVPVNATSLLRLSALYNLSSVKISLQNSIHQPVQFDHVQPIVDSTGRANDLFRRVSASVTLNQDVAYPQAAVDIDGDLCKNFVVTDNSYQNTSTFSCTP